MENKEKQVNVIQDIPVDPQPVVQQKKVKKWLTTIGKIAYKAVPVGVVISTLMLNSTLNRHLEFEKDIYTSLHDIEPVPVEEG